MSNQKINVAIVGANFGQRFVPIYQAHPNVEYVGLCDLNEQRVRKAGKECGVEQIHTSLDEVISSGLYDAVHILTSIGSHAPLCAQVMNAGLHCASAVTMGMTLDDLTSVLETQRRNTVRYMMMETSIYGKVHFYAKQMYARGEFGRIQFMRGVHSQDLEHLAIDWKGFPPMLYITHAIAPLLDLVGTRASRVTCLGSGTMREELHERYNNPYPSALALFQLEDSEAVIEITRTCFENAPIGGEAIGIYGSKRTLTTFSPHKPVLVTVESEPEWGTQTPRRTEKDVQIPYRTDVLPEKLRQFSEGGHGGSHPHLVHEFISSIVEERDPYINAVKAANWCAPGIFANESMKKNGQWVDIPLFE